MATPNPYQNWSGAPKHWVHVPAQRQCPPTPEQLARSSCAGERTARRQLGEWSVAAVAVAVAVAAFVLIGTGGTAEQREEPAPERTNGTSVR